MRKKIWIVVVAAVVATAGIFGIKNYFDKNGSEEASPVDNNISQLRYTVSKENIENTIAMKGMVVNHCSEESVSVQAELAGKEIIDMQVKVYQDVKKDEILFRVDKKEYKSPVNGKVKEILITDNSVFVNILDYDQLYIDAEVNYKYIDRMSLGEKVSVKESNPLADKEVFNEKIAGFGFDVNENMIGVRITNSKNFLPGTEFDIEYRYINDFESYYILKNMLLQDIDGYYVYVEKDGKREKRTVIPGVTFLSRNGDSEQEFIEIISGLSEGEKIVVDIIE